MEKQTYLMKGENVCIAALKTPTILILSTAEFHVSCVFTLYRSIVIVRSLNDDALVLVGGTVAAVPPPFRPSEPALCGSCPLVTPC